MILIEISDGEQGHQAADDASLSINIRSFGYGREPVLQDIIADIPAGSFIGITGRTGSGKSTLLRLILREFDLPAGSASWQTRPYCCWTMPPVPWI